MTLTTPQLQTLKTAIAADPVLAAIPWTPDGFVDVAAALNLTVAPDFYVWKTLVAVQLLMTGNFGWDRVDNLTVGKARIMEWMTRAGLLNMSEDNVRSGILACFAVAGDLNTRQAIFSNGQRKATRGEKLFATGTGSASNDQGVGPAKLGPEGVVTAVNVQAALELQ